MACAMRVAAAERPRAMRVARLAALVEICARRVAPAATVAVARWETALVARY